MADNTKQNNAPYIYTADEGLEARHDELMLDEAEQHPELNA